MKENSYLLATVVLDKQQGDATENVGGSGKSLDFARCVLARMEHVEGIHGANPAKWCADLREA